MSSHVVILGGGLAGLSCGYELVQRGNRVTILEREPHVGGMASSFVEDGDEYWTQDFGPHRFHSQDKNLIQHVRDILGDNIVTAERLSRIVLFGKFFDYPLVTKNVLKSMPRLLLIKALLDYAWVRFCDKTRLRRYDEKTFEGWVTRRFGKTLYKIFFGQYTEKAWGMSPSLISSDWASQRITVLGLWDTIKKTLRRPKAGETPRTLVKSFIYPKYGGIGELARGYARRIEESGTGSQVLTNAPAVKIHRDGMRVTGIEYGKHERQRIEADAYVNTIPVTALAAALAPKAPDEVLKAARSLEYVSIVFVYLKLNRPSVSPDSWVYLPEKHLTVHRISEFKNFSPFCAPRDKTLICAEITCRRGDEIWRASADELRAIAARDLASVGLIQESDVIDAQIRKIPFAYPVYDLDYRSHLEPVMDYVGRLQNLQTTGRQGNYRYNNMDQSVEMGRKLGQELATGVQTGHAAVATGKEYFG
ncbi:MAG: FAD-dependent oxidoreductase [Planctomycetes bacterium]|nr:FAD-dependent oxidoreductase [Planctomycetota bacterium]